MKILDIDSTIDRRPDWVSRTINNIEARCLSRELSFHKCQKGLEIGSASGFSAAVAISQLYQNVGETARLDCFDLSEKCYFDSSRNTGDAVWEIHGKIDNVSMNYGTTSADIHNLDQDYDFLFIDANHKNPWPALDLFSLGRFLKPGALVVLDDLTMIYNSKFRDCNGARDLFRCFTGKKWRYREGSNVGFLMIESKQQILSTVISALNVDWDHKVDESLLSKFADMENDYGINDNSFRKYYLTEMTLNAH